MNLKHLLGGGVAATLITLGSAQASLIIDDFNIAAGTGTTVIANTANPGPNSAVAPITGANIVMNGAAGWTRTITAELIAGVDTVETIVCDTCQAGHVNAEIPATAEGQFVYTGGPISFGTHDVISFDYVLDLDGAVVDFLVNGTLAASTGPLAASLSGASASAALAPGDYSSVTSFAVRVIGTQAADFTIDNITVPVPMTLALFLVGLAGVGMQRKSTQA